MVPTDPLEPERLLEWPEDSYSSDLMEETPAAAPAPVADRLDIFLGGLPCCDDARTAARAPTCPQFPDSMAESRSSNGVDPECMEPECMELRLAPRLRSSLAGETADEEETEVDSECERVAA